MKIKSLYYYLYYRIYKFLESTADIKFLISWKTSVIIDMLAVFICLSLTIYYSVFTGTILNLENSKLIVGLYIAIIGIPNYFIFQHNDRWKKIVDEFDKSNKKIKKGGYVVFFLIVLVVANLIFSYYLLYSEAKKNNTGPYSEEYIEQQK